MRKITLIVLLVWASYGCAPVSSVPPTPAPKKNEVPLAVEEPEVLKPTLEASGALKRGQIEFTMINVGQGDGFILRTSTGITLVIDAGTGKGGKAIAEFLQRERISTVDLLVLTHPHADHIAGVPNIMKAATVAAAWVSGYAGSTRTQAKVLEALESSNVPVTAVRRGNKAVLEDAVEITVLAPEDPLIDNSRSDANANSIVLWIKHGEIDFLLTGDAEHETESRVLEVLRGRPPPEFEVLKVAHHGSRHASSKKFLNRVRPQVALISCGLKNRYKHPHPDTLGRLEEFGVQVFRTDLHGMVQLRSDGENILIITEKQVQPEPEPGADHGLPGKIGLLRVH